MLTRRVVILLALLLVAAVPAQADQEESCDSDCEGAPACDDACQEGECTDCEAEQPPQGGNQTSGGAGSNPASATICRVINVTDPTDPYVDPDGCIQRLIYSFIRP